MLLKYIFIYAINTLFFSLSAAAELKSNVSSGSLCMFCSLHGFSCAPPPRYLTWPPPASLCSLHSLSGYWLSLPVHALHVPMVCVHWILISGFLMFDLNFDFFFLCLAFKLLLCFLPLFCLPLVLVISF